MNKEKELYELTRAEREEAERNEISYRVITLDLGGLSGAKLEKVLQKVREEVPQAILITDQKKQFLDQYTKDAIRTESNYDNNHLEVNFILLYNLLNIYINTGEILDSLKKHIFYKKSNKFLTEFDSRLKNIQDALDNLVDEKTLEGNDNLLDVMDVFKNIDIRAFHAILGIMTESSELAEIVQQLMKDTNQQIDTVHVSEECPGDIGWYTAILCDALKINWQDALTKNINKLKVRYPEKFTSEHAENRKLDHERKVLEGQT